MKINAVKTNLVLCLVLLAGQHGKSQGTFSNFDFESAIPPFNPDLFGEVPISSALPGWTAYINGTPRDRVLYNDSSLGGPSVSLFDSLSPFPSLRPLEGSYSVYLHAGAGIGQTGRVPDGTASLTFLISPGSALNVSFAGQNIPLVQFGTSGNNTIIAGNISRFAGQTGELRFLGGGLFDDVRFSTSAIPEPGAVSMFCIGAVFIVVRGWKLGGRGRRSEVGQTSNR